MTTNSPLPIDWAAWALVHGDRLAGLPLHQWGPVIHQARRADVLARLAVRLDLAGQLAVLPSGPRQHLQSALRVAQAQQAEVRREAAWVAQALAPLGVPVVLLKGAAYVAADLPAQQGRLFSDIDILVPRAALGEAEGALMLAGWMGSHHDAYDQRYYREWMHELPPMQHLQRGTALDMHHNILPLTVRRAPDAALLLAAAKAVPGGPKLHVLAPCDMVLHSMAHLFHNDDLSHGLRDLSDLDLLLRHWAAVSGFWGDLLARAADLHLERPLAYGLWASAAVLGTPVPADVQAQATDAAQLGPLGPAMRWLWRRALRSPHQAADLPGRAVADAALYLRAHWLRMPPVLLTRHLGIKAWKRLTGKAPA